MRRVISVWGALAMLLVFAANAAAQGAGRLNGQILDKQGNPWEGVSVELKNPETGQTFTFKTDKNGKFNQLGLRTGIYTIHITSPKDNLDYSKQVQINDGQENEVKIDFKQLIAENAAAHPEEIAKKEEAENKFKMMKAHFDAGIAAMNDAGDLDKQIKAAAADQKAVLQQKRLTTCQTAITEFKASEEGVTAKETKNHAIVWARLGNAYECAGQNQDAADAFQKAIDLEPQAPYYLGLSTNLAKAAVAQNDPNVTKQKMADASAGCEKGVALDAAAGATCWKNLGIVLKNANRPELAAAPLQKASEANPKDTQVWYLLGSALAANMTFKEEGGKQIAVLAPGTMEAFQKCVDTDTSGSYSTLCKESITELQTLTGGQATSIGTKKKKG